MFVLVITPEPDTSDVARQALEANGWWVTAVEDRETALRSASDQAPQLVLVDAELAAAGELVSIFASRHGGPGALVVAPENGEVDEASAAADEVLSRPVDGDALVAAAQRLLKQPQPMAEEALPSPGKVLNANDIFGDLLLEMEGGSGAAEPVEPPSLSSVSGPSTEGETPGPVAEAPESHGAEEREDPSSENTLDTVSVVIPSAESLAEPAGSPEAAGEVEAAGKSLESEEPEEVAEAGDAEETERTQRGVEAVSAEGIGEAGVIGETATEGLDREASELVSEEMEREPIADRELEEEARSEEESPEEPPAEIEPDRAAAMADEESLSSEIDEALEESLGPPPSPPALDLVVPPPSEELSEGLEPPLAFEGEPDLEIPEPEPVSEDAGKPSRPAAAAMVPTQLEADLEVGFDVESGTEKRPSVRDRLTAALGGSEAAAAEKAADSPTVAVAAAAVEGTQTVERNVVRPSLWRRGRLPGGVRFWLGMAAGLLVFVLTTLLLDHFFGSPAPRQPQEVVAPAGELDGVDLEELVDREMAEREAELRESLLEEERRLQSELDELDGDDGR